MTADNIGFYFQNRLIQTSQTGGQWYNDTSHFSIPWLSFHSRVNYDPKSLIELVPVRRTLPPRCRTARRPPRPRRRPAGFQLKEWAGNTKGGSITVLLTSCLTGLD